MIIELLLPVAIESGIRWTSTDVVVSLVNTGAVILTGVSDTVIFVHLAVLSRVAGYKVIYTARLMSQSKRIFGDIFVISHSIKLETHLDLLKVLDELWGEISFKSDNE